MTVKTIAQTVETFLAQFKDVSDKEKLLMFSAVVDCLRYISSINNDSRASARPLQMANFIAAARDFPWHTLNFFATSEIASEDGAARAAATAHGVASEDVDAVILRALPNFFELIADGVLESNPDIDQCTLLGATIAHVADTLPRPAPPPKPVPEIFTHKHVSRVYAPQPLTPELFNELGMLYGCYTRPDRQQLRAFCFNTSADDRFFILESGEVVLHTCADLADADSAVSFDPYNRQEDFARLPASLCVYTHLALADSGFYQHVLSPAFLAAHAEPSVNWFAGRLGAFKHPVRSLVLSRADVAPLLDLSIDSSEKHASIPPKSQLRFSVSRPNLAFTAGLDVVLSAHAGATGLVFTSALTQTQDDNVAVLMRHDYPRRQVFGFYVFPLSNGLVNLTVQM